MGNSAHIDIIRQLAQGEYQEVNQALAFLHRRVYPQVANFMKKHWGTPNDTEDIFQDALLSLYKLAKNGALDQDTNIEAYLFAICKNLWFQQLRKRRDIVSLEENEKTIKVQEVPLFRMMQEEEQKEIKLLINQLGEGCRKVLISFYYKKMRMREIAERMGYSSEQVAKNQKSSCMKKLRQLIFQSPVFKNRVD